MRAIKSEIKRARSFRPGFTLVELMVVVAIMAVLAALVAGVVVKATEAQRNSNTMTTMEVIKSSLSRQLQAVLDDGKDRERKGTGTISGSVKEAFPQAAELAAPNNLSKNYQRYLARNPVGTNDARAMLTRMILEAGPHGKLETDMLPKGALSADKPLLLDAWGEPITLEVTRGAKVKFTLKSPNVSEAVSN